MMKKWFLLSALALLIFASCKKSNNSTDCSQLAPTNTATAAEKAYLQAYLAANGLTATALEKNGMYYVISNQGGGISPNLCSNLTLTYSGNLITGTTDGGLFDATPAGQTSSFALSGLITAWKIIFPLVKAGGNVTLYVPPSLAYGAQSTPSRPGFVGIPANSYLKFTVSLIDVQ
jgi:FKBP-type peptidyl-prolyl cis-trans isomerase FkpA